MIKPSKKKSDYETNDVIIGLLRPTDHRNGRLDLPIAHHLHRWNRSNPDIAIKTSGCYVKNAVKMAPIWRKMSIFAKNTAHNERFC
jgi:hypothetical protein